MNRIAAVAVADGITRVAVGSGFDHKLKARAGSRVPHRR
jgi:hypothetical protein